MNVTANFNAGGARPGYQTRDLHAPVPCPGSPGKMRGLAELPKRRPYWISTLGMTARPTMSSPSSARRGFTLIEAAIVTAIVGIGIVGLLELLAAGSMANINSKQLTTAVFLANNVNEMMQGYDYDSLKPDFDNKTFQPPKDGRGQNLVGFDNWQQVVDVSYVQPNLLRTIVPDTQYEPTSRVTVKILANNELVYETQWIAAHPNDPGT
jgi:prepilin-type N-terminal cleavage/methylation domain-containing protein